ncbi:hypothetical protein SARC_00974 [Sphaeroforma arctica JP610]|uniref:Uncharacterized protein n=1 Tax=Sphaeroforma arctica JP610 TaxID=667725 RepID=A0A0L0GD94_9EUKA|nr:hypothetical protein SARC_00974 [Sphaeroforma arctica JP610]KNC86879.1 hypothetical protein SARC_00974 [Sphaeroforma arctica JP610]|eukprot:XP_014160781.1 hypothetical protein SARC_00974 [Sphaeroforma arctica JP610]
MEARQFALDSFSPKISIVTTKNLSDGCRCKWVFLNGCADRVQCINSLIVHGLVAKETQPRLDTPSTQAVDSHVFESASDILEPYSDRRKYVLSPMFESLSTSVPSSGFVVLVVAPCASIVTMPPVLNSIKSNLHRGNPCSPNTDTNYVVTVFASFAGIVQSIEYPDATSNICKINLLPLVDVTTMVMRFICALVDSSMHSIYSNQIQFLVRDAEREERMQAMISLRDQEQAEKDKAHASEIQGLKISLLSMNEQFNVKKVKTLENTEAILRVLTTPLPKLIKEKLKQDKFVKLSAIKKLKSDMPAVLDLLSYTKLLTGYLMNYTLTAVETLDYLHREGLEKYEKDTRLATIDTNKLCTFLTTLNNRRTNTFGSKCRVCKIFCTCEVNETTTRAPKATTLRLATGTNDALHSIVTDKILVKKTSANSSTNTTSRNASHALRMEAVNMIPASTNGIQILSLYSFLRKAVRPDTVPNLQKLTNAFQGYNKELKRILYYT